MEAEAADNRWIALLTDEFSRLGSTSAKEKVAEIVQVSLQMRKLFKRKKHALAIAERRMNLLKHIHGDDTNEHVCACIGEYAELVRDYSTTEAT